ncbi:MAG: hypothetical protein GC154_07975 [bacterium]|nr:hypothetical protein [bacterium]
MNNSQLYGNISVILELIKKSNSKKLGHTAIMKYLFLLQELKKAPLGYDFRLYTYGPYDSDVLNHLEVAESLGATSTSIVPYPKGYGYEVKIGPNDGSIRSSCEDLLETQKGNIDWIVKTFNGKNASELELASTIVYVHLNKKHKKEDSLKEEVKKIKPHFPMEKITSMLDFLRENNVITSPGTARGTS